MSFIATAARQPGRSTPSDMATMPPKLVPSSTTRWRCSAAIASSTSRSATSTR